MTSEVIDVLLPENSDGELTLETSVVNSMEVEEYVDSSDNILCTGDNPGVRNIEIICEPLWNSVSPVTHIEIIKSNSRRVTGANRVVPLLTNTLQAGKLAVTNSGLAEVYKSFLYDLGNCDNNRKCLLCLQVFLSCTELEHHVKGVHNLNFSANQCFVCRKKYVFEEQLGDHLKQIHGIHCPDLICKLCFMEFGTCIEQKAHERKHEQSFVCHICSEKFSMDYLYQKHLNQHLILHENTQDCKKCGRRFKTSISLDLHKKRHVHIECTCGSVFNNDLDILVHLKNHETDGVVKFFNLVEQIDHNENILETMLASYSTISKRKTLSIAESECSTLMKDVSDCLSDIVTVVSQNDMTSADKRLGIECKLCGKNMSSNTELLEHRHNFHLRNRTCPFCGKRNRSVSQTWRHMQSHIVKNKNSSLKQLPESQDLVEESSITKIKQPRTNTRLYNCNICSRKFLYPGSRDNHVLQHSKDKCESWKCNVCEEEFSHPGLLMSHSSVHNPSVKCNVCDKVFPSQSSLRSHLKSHSNNEKKRKHKCNFCSVECPTLFGLQSHIRCHTGERPYTCGQCQRRFKRLQGVKKHIQVVHNSASLEYHSCSICQKTFNSPANLIRHYLRIHCHIRRFVCGICGSRFSQNQDLRRHFKVSHELDMPNINGTDRKKLKEIYVIPSIDNLPEKHPHAIKINSIVAEEKAKFKGLSELMTKKHVGQEDSQGVLKSIGQFIQEFSTENEEQLIELAPTSSGRNNKAMIDTTFSDENHECSQNSIFTKENNANEKLFANNETCSLKVILCEICGKKCLGEKEYLKHTPSGNIYVSCSHCESRFCDDVLLSYHISSEHKIVSCNSVEVFSKKDNILQDSSINGQSLKHFVDVSCGLNEQICTLEQNNSLLVTSSENIFTIVPDPTIHIDTISSENIHSVSPNTQAIQSNDAHIPTPLNINGFVVQNIIFQQTPAILQTVPLTFSNSELMNSSSISPVLTLDSVPFVSDFQTKPYLLNMTKSQKLTSMNETNLTEFISEDVVDSCKDMSVVETDKTCENNHLKECEVNLENSIELSNSNGEERLKVTIDTLTNEVLNEEMVNDKPKEVNCEQSKESTPNIFPSNGDKKHSTGTKPYGCHHCGKHFSEKCNLKVHLMVHTGERPFTCEECGKRIRYRKDVLDHKRMHLGEKPFSCDECGRKFLRKRELNRHKIIHTGKKKHKCPICGKAFARLDLLKLGHLPTHIEDKSKLLHSCSICHKSFKLKSKLKQHEILHSGLKEFQCHICHKRFALGSYLRTHLHLHLKKDKFLKCNICHHEFATKTAFKSHMETCEQRPTKNKNEKLLKDFPTGIQNNLIGKGNAELETGIGRDIELQDVDLSMLDADSCNAVIYLQMTPEDLKLSFGRSDD